MNIQTAKRQQLIHAPRFFYFFVDSIRVPSNGEIKRTWVSKSQRMALEEQRGESASRDPKPLC